MLARRIILRKTLHVVAMAVGLVGAVGCIYLIEKSATILSHVLNYNMDFGNFAWLSLFYFPVFMDDAFPLAILCAAYFVLVGARENREFLVVAGAGSGPSTVAWIVSLSGIVILVLTLGLSGFINPVSSFGFRATLQDAVNTIFRDGGSRARFYGRGGQIMYTAPATTGSTTQKIRVFEFEDENLKRLITSQDASLKIEQARVYADIATANLYLFDQIGSSAKSDGDAQMVFVRSEGLSYGFAMQDTFKIPVRNRTAELTFHELLASPETRANAKSRANKALAQMVVSSLMALVGGLTAIFAVALTTRRTILFALPAGCAFVIATGVALRPVVGSIAAQGSLVVIGAAVITAVTGMVAIFAASHQFESRLAGPRLSRT